VVLRLELCWWKMMRQQPSAPIPRRRLTCGTYSMAPIMSALLLWP